MEAPTKQTLERLPMYLQYLRKLREDGKTTVSSPTLAQEFGQSEILVRKDLASVNPGAGRPRNGFEIDGLITSIERELGFYNRANAAVVGAGRLGRALLAYKGFDTFGSKIVCAFDSDPELIGTTVEGKRIYNTRDIAGVCAEKQVDVGIITVPAAAAEEVCATLVSAGVRAVWNFAPVHLTVPQGIALTNENLAVSLALLTRRLARDREVGSD